MSFAQFGMNKVYELDLIEHLNVDPNTWNAKLVYELFFWISLATISIKHATFQSFSLKFIIELAIEKGHFR